MGKKLTHKLDDDPWEYHGYVCRSNAKWAGNLTWRGVDCRACLKKRKKRKGE